jgi:hypothetical protein
MNILLLSNSAEKCGIAEYGRDLARELGRWYGVIQTDGASPWGWPWSLPIIIVNWHNGVLDVTPKQMKVWQSQGSKVIVILHNSWEGVLLGEEDKDILRVADLVVAHEPMEFKPAPKKFAYIKHGAPVLKDLPTTRLPAIGTGGFQTDWKRFDVIQRAAALVDGTGVVVDWGPKERVVESLAMCTLNIFWHQPLTVASQLGQSGSVLLGVAAGRPMIISRCRKFRVLLEEYGDEFYICDTEQDVYDTVRDIMVPPGIPESDLKFPTRCRKEMAWPVVAEQYHLAMESLLKEARCASV